MFTTYALSIMILNKECEHINLLCIENAITKSLLLKGFVNIQDSFRGVKRNKKIYKLCSKFFSTFKKTNMKEFFDTWKTYN